MEAVDVDFLNPGNNERKALLNQLEDVIENYLRDVERMPIHNSLSPLDSSTLLKDFDFNSPIEPRQLISFVDRAFRQYSVHASHPSYFGRFNPATTLMGVIADALVATFNPQLATWNHGAFPNAVEMHLIRALGEKFGYKREDIDGTFTTGGSEANHTAVIAALTSCFPAFAQNGLRSLEGQPVMYASREAHASLKKAARACGLGTKAFIEVPVNDRLEMDVSTLKTMIARDRKQGLIPFLVVGTAGTTSTGAIDPLEQIGALCAHERLWFHVDAAWAGAVALVPELNKLLNGISRSDSITFDAHKWLSVPMSAGTFLTRHNDILSKTFECSAAYMPIEEKHGEINPYNRTLQWSRRFAGLKLFLNLATFGWEGYASAIRHQIAMGEFLREKLLESGWLIRNETGLPIVCFTLEGKEANNSSAITKIIKEVVASGDAWASTSTIEDTIVARTCITNFRTEKKDIVEFVKLLHKARINHE